MCLYVYTAPPAGGLTPAAALTPYLHTCTPNREPLRRKRIRKEFNKIAETALTRRRAWPDKCIDQQLFTCNWPFFIPLSLYFPTLALSWASYPATPAQPPIPLYSSLGIQTSFSSYNLALSINGVLEAQK